MTKVTHSDPMRFMIEQRMIRLELYNLLGEKQSDFKQCTQLQKELHELKSDFVAKNHLLYECSLKGLVAKTDRSLIGMMEYVRRRRNSEQGPLSQNALSKINKIRMVNEIRRKICSRYDNLVKEMVGEEVLNEARLDLIVEIVSLWIYKEREKDDRKNEEREKKGKKREMTKTLEEYVDDLLKKLDSKKNLEMEPREKSLKDLFEKTYIQIQELQSSIQTLKNETDHFQVLSTQHFPPSEIYEEES